LKLALFDLDNTLLAGDSDFEWAQFLIGKGVLDREVYEARNQDSRFVLAMILAACAMPDARPRANRHSVEPEH